MSRNRLVSFVHAMNSESGAYQIDVDLAVPIGYAARLWYWDIFSAANRGVDTRTSMLLTKTARPFPQLTTVFTTPEQVLERQAIQRLYMRAEIVGTAGLTTTIFPHRFDLRPFEYEVITPMQVIGFQQVALELGFELWYELVKRSSNEVAAILNWQGSEILLGQVV